MKNLAIIHLLCLAIGFTSCGSESQEKRDSSALGLWRGVIQMQEQELPFHFRLSGSSDSLMLTLINGKEELEAGLVKKVGDSLIMPMHIFDAEIRAVINPAGDMQGKWIKHYVAGYELPFKARQGENFRFETQEELPSADLTGRWDLSFMGKDSSGRPNAVGIFQQNKNGLMGTFLTPTGDYRYLEGNIAGDDLYLSAFDGEHAYLFQGKLVSPNRLEGTYWNGRSWEEKWIAIRNDYASLPAADSLTFLKPGEEKLDFSFPNLDGEPVSLSDSAFAGKVVIVQLLGTWCPNCMDETKFLADWHKRHRNDDVAVIGLAYEKKPDFEYARERILKMKERLEVDYDILVAGTSEAGDASKSLPMLNHVMAFPTTIFIDKAGRVRRIHTGFSGPGTGEEWESYVVDFNRFTDKLLQEPVTNKDQLTTSP